MEMTGLDEKTDFILEVAIIITDIDFKPIDTYHKIIYQPAEILERMDTWCKNTHGKSGLTAAVPHGESLEKVEKEVCALITKHFKTERAVLYGNSIHQDRKFIDQHMKDFAKLLHYRIVDVSSFKEVFKRKYGVEYKKAKESNHRALDDVQESINELSFYLTKVDPAKS